MQRASQRVFYGGARLEQAIEPQPAMEHVNKKALLDELERKLHPFLEVLGAIIMLTPLLWIFSLLFGASE